MWCVNNNILVLSIFFIGFLLSMFMFIGGPYPSYRFSFTWRWSVAQFMSSMFLSMYSAVVIYKENTSFSVNRLCFILLTILSVSATSLAASIFPPTTKTEFSEFIRTEYENGRRVPKFIEWFQYTQGCCGIDNYKDYIDFFGTRLREKELVVEHSNLSQIVQGAENVETADIRVVDEILFDIPRSCCSLNFRNDRDCGIGIPYTTDKEIDLRVNNLTKGCYQVFYDILYHLEPVQIAFFYFIYRLLPLLNMLLSVANLGVHFYYYNKLLKYMHAPDDAAFED